MPLVCDWVCHVKMCTSNENAILLFKQNLIAFFYWAIDSMLICLPHNLGIKKSAGYKNGPYNPNILTTKPISNKEKERPRNKCFT